MPDGTEQEPGGWNRFMLEVSDLEDTVETLRAAGVHFRNEMVTGVGSKQIMVDDPSGNPVELFEPKTVMNAVVRPATTRIRPRPARRLERPAQG